MKSDPKHIDGKGVNWIYLALDRHIRRGCCQTGNERSGSINFRAIL
jgi:hypothetical protein